MSKGKDVKVRVDGKELHEHEEFRADPDFDEEAWKEALDHAKKVLKVIGFESISVAYVQGYYAGVVRTKKKMKEQR